MEIIDSVDVSRLIIRFQYYREQFANVDNNELLDVVLSIGGKIYIKSMMLGVVPKDDILDQLSVISNADNMSLLSNQKKVRFLDKACFEYAAKTFGDDYDFGRHVKDQCTAYLRFVDKIIEHLKSLCDPT